MRIIAHNGAAIFGGGERWACTLLHGLQERGHAVTLLCNHEVVVRGARDFGVAAEMQHLGGDVALHHAAALARVLRQRRPDVLLHTLFKKTWLGGIAGRLARVPHSVAGIVLSTDTPRSGKYRFAAEHLIDSWVLNATGIYEDFVRPLSPAARARVANIPNGVDARPVTVTRAEMRRAFGVPLAAPVIGTVARLARQKRLDRLLHTLPLLPTTWCMIAGDGSLRAELEQLAQDIGVAGRVRFLGHRDDVGNVLEALDVFVLSSDREGLAAAMIEALAAGRPLVTTDVTGARDILHGEPRAGRIVTFEPAALADAIRSTLQQLTDPQRRAHISAAARRAGSRFSRARMVTDWEELLRDGVLAFRERRAHTSAVPLASP